MLNVLISLTTDFNISFPKFNKARKEDNIHHSPPMDMVDKAKMSVKRQLF